MLYERQKKIQKYSQKYHFRMHYQQSMKNRRIYLQNLENVSKRHLSSKAYIVYSIFFSLTKDL